MSKKNIRVCRYTKCNHQIREINLDTESYIQNGTMYFHKDCYEAKEAEKSQKRKSTMRQFTPNEKADIDAIKSLWATHIDKNAEFGKLVSILKVMIIKKNITSDYLLFVVNFCIKNKYRLQYPPGLYYFIDNKEIKNAYYKKQNAGQGIDISNFKAVEQKDVSPKFTIAKKKRKGFQSILE